MTRKPPRDGMSEKQIEKAVNKAAAEFEMACVGGKVVNIRKLQNLIEDWFVIHETALTASTILKYRNCCDRILSKTRSYPHRQNKNERY